MPLFIYKPDEWVSVGIDWEPPLITLIKEGGKCAFVRNDSMGIILAANTPIDTLYRTAARHAFFDLGPTTLKLIYKHKKGPPDSGSDTFDLAKDLVMDCLDLEALEAAPIMKHRFFEEAIDDEAIMKLEGAYEIMSKDEITAVAETVTKQAANTVAKQAYKTKYNTWIKTEKKKSSGGKRKGERFRTSQMERASGDASRSDATERREEVRPSWVRPVEGEHGERRLARAYRPVL